MKRAVPCWWAGQSGGFGGDFAPVTSRSDIGDDVGDISGTARCVESGLDDEGAKASG